MGEPSRVSWEALAQVVAPELRASRPKDIADVSQLVVVGIDIGEVRQFLEAHAPERTPVFDQIVQRATRDGRAP